MMNTILRAALFGLTLMTCLMGTSLSSSADEATSDSTTPPTQQHRHHGGFRMGVCVGQALAKAGVTLPATPGDQTTHAAFKTAIEGCRAQFKNHTRPSSNNS